MDNTGIAVLNIITYTLFHLLTFLYLFSSFPYSWKKITHPLYGQKKTLSFSEKTKSKFLKKENMFFLSFINNNNDNKFSV